MRPKERVSKKPIFSSLHAKVSQSVWTWDPFQHPKILTNPSIQRLWPGASDDLSETVEVWSNETSWKQLKPAMTSWKNYNTWRQTNKKWNKSFRGRRTQIKRRSSCSHAPMLFGVYPFLVHARWSVILLCLVQFPSLSSVLTALSFDFHGFHSCSGSSMFPVYLVFRWLVRVSFIWGSLFFHLVLS